MMAFVTGAASSGKSAWAEALALRLAAGGRSSGVGAAGSPPSNLVYLATMRPYGEEGARRIERHRELRRGKGFHVWEVPCDLSSALDGSAPLGLSACTVLLEDLGNLVANEMFATDGAVAGEESVKRSVARGIAALEARCGNLVVVGSEVGVCGAPVSPETRAYQRALGACACAAAARAEAAVEVVAGAPNVLKGGIPWA